MQRVASIVVSALTLASPACGISDAMYGVSTIRLIPTGETCEGWASYNSEGADGIAWHEIELRCELSVYPAGVEQRSPYEDAPKILAVYYRDDSSPYIDSEVDARGQWAEIDFSTDFPYADAPDRLDDCSVGGVFPGEVQTFGENISSLERMLVRGQSECVEFTADLDENTPRPSGR